MPWIMRATPTLYDLHARLAVDCWVIDWHVPANVKGGRGAVQIGDRVWFAVLEDIGSFGTIIGRGTILSKVVEANSPERDLALPYCPNRAAFEQPEHRVFVEITDRIAPSFPLARERHNPVLSNMLIFRLTVGSMFWVEDAEATELNHLIP